jgi:hypothetical protein
MDTPDTDTHIILDDWFEKTYGWGKTVKREKYDKPFITFMHDPNIPSANFIRECTNFMKAKQREMYKLSHLDVLPKHIDEVYRYLSTIIVFSQHHATNLINKLQIDADVVCIMHPIPNCGAVTHFNPDKYFVNEKRCLFQIGWWLRRLDVFLSLDCNKTILIKDNRTKDGVCALDHITFEISKHKKDRVRENRRRIQNRQQPIIQKLNTQIVSFLPNNEYDHIFTNNIMFLDVYAASANNVVLECILFHTPLLARRHPAVVEYLGESYPFFFNNLHEANKKIKDNQLIRDTYQYLKNMDTSFLSMDTFVNKLNKLKENVVQNYKPRNMDTKSCESK